MYKGLKPTDLDFEAQFQQAVSKVDFISDDEKLRLKHAFYLGVMSMYNVHWKYENRHEDDGCEDDEDIIYHADNQINTYKDSFI